MPNKVCAAGSSWRRSVGIPLRRAIVGVLACALLWAGTPIYAQSQDQPGAAADWQPAGLTEAVLQLFTPTTGAFFARTQTGLARSDDGGVTWRPVSLPPAPTGVIAVDPTDHTTIYAVGQAGVYKTSDDARTWQVILPASTAVPVVTCWRTGQDYLSAGCVQTPQSVPAFPIDNVVVSAADHQLVYATFAVQNDAVTASGVLRSQDGGQSWQPLIVDGKEQSVPLDLPHYTLVAPIATNADQVFVGSWSRGSHFGDTIGAFDQSLDRGTTWREGSGSGDLDLAVVGGQPQSPATFFVALEHTGYDYNSHHTIQEYPEFRRTDDDGVHWQIISSFSEGDGSIPSGALAQYRITPEWLYSGI